MAGQMLSAPVTSENAQKFLQSIVSEDAYELDLPSLPPPIDGSPRSSIYTSRPTEPENTSSPARDDVESPIYDIVENQNERDDSDEEKTASELTPYKTLSIIKEESADFNHLSTWIEDKNGFASADHDTEDLDGEGLTKSMSLCRYTKVRRSQMNKDGIYKSLVQQNISFDDDGVEGDTFNSHKTNYTQVPSNGSIPVGQDLPPVRHTSWNLRRTIQRHYTRMMKSKKTTDNNNNGGLCWSTSHKGAKRFYGFLVAIIILLIMAMIGVIIASLGWTLIRTEANRIEGNLNNFMEEAGSCQVGQNWTSLVINATTPSLRLRFNASNTRGNLSLNDLLTNVTNGNSVPEQKQLLVYIVLQTQTRGRRQDRSYINFAMWTRRMNRRRTFRKYMSIPNQSQLPFMVSSRDFWFPFKNTDGFLHITANVLGSTSDSPEMIPVDLTAYIAGYC